MHAQPHTINFQIPDWVSEYANQGVLLATDEDRMQFVIEASRENIERGTGGPFAAAIFEVKSHRLVALGVNVVTTQQSSILHAEMVAIALAQIKLQTYDLGSKDLPAHELVTSTEPCAMCYGAVPWSGVYRLVTGATDADARSIGFDEGPKVKDWINDLTVRGIHVVTKVRQREAAQVLSDYRLHAGHIYNSKGAA